MLTSTSPAGDEVDAALVANGEYDVITSTLVNGNGSTEKPSTTVRALVEHFEENDLLLHREREALLPNGVGMATGVAVGFETAGTASGADANTDAESDGARKRKSVLDPQASRALATAAGTDANADADTDSSTSRGSAGNGHYCKGHGHGQNGDSLPSSTTDGSSNGGPDAQRWAPCRNEDGHEDAHAPVLEIDRRRHASAEAPVP